VIRRWGKSTGKFASALGHINQSQSTAEFSLAGSCLLLKKAGARRFILDRSRPGLFPNQ
jgi:hypothetical protein